MTGSPLKANFLFTTDNDNEDTPESHKNYNIKATKTYNGVSVDLAR